MESSLYDLEFAADWSLELFPGQLLTNGGPDFSTDQGWSVLQGDESPAGGEAGGSPAPSQYSAVESPIAEPLQDSIWSEASDGLGGLEAQSPEGLKGEWCEGGDIEDSLQFVTPHDLTLLTPSEHCPPNPYSASLLEDHISQNIFPPPPLHPSSIDNVKYEYADISAVGPFALSSPSIALSTPSIAAGTLDDVIKAPLRFPAFAACNDDGAFYSPDVSLELLLLPQEVPTDEDEDIPVELDLGLESASLLRDEQILGMLMSLRDAASREDAPVLSPVSAEDCESILSIPDCPRSPQEGGDSAMIGAPLSPADSGFGTACSVADSSCSTLSTAYLQTVLTPKAAASHRRFASQAISPYGVPVATTPAASPLKSEHRRLKKKEQNKTAALRYRVKKREEKGVVLTEVETLELKNGELRARADDLQREIDYLRALLEEIRRT